MSDSQPSAQKPSPPAANFIDIVLLGKEYRVACRPEEREALEAAASYVGNKMNDIVERTKNPGTERVAVMAALNIAHDFLSAQAKADAQTQELAAVKSEAEKTAANLIDPESFDFANVGRRITDMETQLDLLLSAQ